MYLEQRAAEDALFAKKYRNPAKNIDDCVTYILNYVQKSGCNGFTDGEIFGQAIHYYEENEIEVGNKHFRLSNSLDCNRPSGQSEYFIFFGRLAASGGVPLF